MIESADSGMHSTADPLADRALRLFTFLGQAQQLRNPRVHDLDSYTRDGAVHWLHAVPEHPAIRHGLSGGSTDPTSPILTVDRVPRVDPPAPAGSLLAWLAGPIDDAHDEPVLHAERYIPGPGPDDEGVVLRLEEHPDITEAHERYLRTWQIWAQTEQHDERARALYGDLFSTYVTATGHSEELELVVGTGLLAWRPDEHTPVRRHLLTTAAAITFDDGSGRLAVTVGDVATPSRVELEMLDPALVTNPALVNGVREEVSASEHHPLDRDRAGEFVRRLVHSLAADAEYQDADEPGPVSPRPVASFAPALLLRKRTQQGMVEIFRQITDQIAHNGAVPSGLRPLIDPDAVPPVRADGEHRDGAVVRVDEEPFLPLPVNDVQLRILQRVDGNAQTLIQGPPGTGKTHTAAVLISHLLAQGKRVLVTAHTDRALREVRTKLPDPIKPLAVSVVGASREDMADLRVAVERIAAAAGEHDDAEAERIVDRLMAAIDHLRRQRAELYNRSLDARRHEIDAHEIAGYRGTFAAIAQRLAEEAPELDWIETYGDRVAGPPPLTGTEICAWRRRLLDTELLADEPAATRRLVAADALVTPDSFAELVAAEARAAEHSASFATLRGHPSYPAVARLDEPARSGLAGRLRALRQEFHALGQRREPWVRDALNDVLTGRSGTWTARRATLGGLLGEADAALRALGPVTDVQVRGDLTGLEHHAEALIVHLESGGVVKVGTDGLPKLGVLTPRVVKSAAPLFERIRVDGSAPTTAPRLHVFLHWLTGARIMAALDRAWPASVTIPAEDTLHERFEWHRTEVVLLDRLLTLAGTVDAEERRLEALGVPHPHWPDPRDVDAVAALPESAAADEAAHRARRILDSLGEQLTSEARWPDADAAVSSLLDAVHRRDQGGYDTAYRRVDRLHHVRTELAARNEAASRLRAVAPGIHDAIATVPEDPRWDEWLPGFEDAWNRAVAQSSLSAHTAPNVNAVQREISQVDDRIRSHVQELAATRAWTHAVGPGRLTPSSRASLEQYAALVRRFGKTGGQYKVQRQAEIRDAMDRCRPAVPVWIMPLYRIADQLRIAPDMFDVVIVDEASQAGLEASFLQYMSPRIVVIGDDKQVSPAAVGVDQQQLRDLGNQYLYDDPWRATWQDPQRSLFDEARMRFRGMLTLVEHRRCVPEIINFSNRIAYEPDNVRLIPVRQFGADRLAPIKTVFVEDGYEKGGSSTKVNPPEVEAVVTRIEECIADPRYDGLTFGVISLLGTAQAKTIEKALLERVSPEDWSARDLRCGDAADFQGSERDVMFLSMVAVPSETRRLAALTATQYVQRYNVAASRAKDQMWVFHSVRLDQLHNTEDMRFQLLDYCYGVQKRSAVDDDRAVSAPVPENERVNPFGSLFEQRVCNRLLDRGYSVVPQFPALGYSIDLVVTGASARLAIECDGDFWHGPDAHQNDMARQRELERCGWTFVRILESEFYLDPARAMAAVWDRLAELDVHPSGWETTDDGADAGHEVDSDDTDEESPLPADDLPERAAEAAEHDRAPAEPDRFEPEQHAELAPDDRSIELTEDVPVDADESPEWTYYDRSSAATETLTDSVADSAIVPSAPADSQQPRPYPVFAGTLPAVDVASRAQIVDGLIRIVAAEGPVLGHRLHTAYVRASGGMRVGSQISRTLNQALGEAERRGLVVKDNPLREPGNKPCTYRLTDQPESSVRERGPRPFDQIPPAELAEVMRDVAAEIGWDDANNVFRTTIARYGFSQVGSAIRQRLTAVSRLLPRSET